MLLCGVCVVCVVRVVPVCGVCGMCVVYVYFLFYKLTDTSTCDMLSKFAVSNHEITFWRSPSEYKTAMWSLCTTQRLQAFHTLITLNSLTSPVHTRRSSICSLMQKLRTPSVISSSLRLSDINPWMRVIPALQISHFVSDSCSVAPPTKSFPPGSLTSPIGWSLTGSGGAMTRTGRGSLMLTRMRALKMEKGKGRRSREKLMRRRRMRMIWM